MHELSRDARRKCGSFQDDRTDRPPFEFRLQPHAAGLADQPTDNFFVAQLENARRVAQNLRALRGHGGAPFNLRRFGGLKSFVDIFDASAGEFGDNLAGKWI